MKVGSVLTFVALNNQCPDISRCKYLGLEKLIFIYKAYNKNKR
jgi:hypothetical protein